MPPVMKTPICVVQGDGPFVSVPCVFMNQGGRKQKDRPLVYTVFDRGDCPQFVLPEKEPVKKLFAVSLQILSLSGTVPFFTAKAYNYRRPRLKKDINHLSALIQEETGNEGF